MLNVAAGAGVESVYPHAAHTVNLVTIQTALSPVVLSLSTGYFDCPNKPITDLRLSHFAHRVLCFFQSHSRPGMPRVRFTHGQIAEAFATSHDTVARAIALLVKYGYIEQDRQRGEDGRLLDYVYDITPTLNYLPESQSAFRRTGQKAVAKTTTQVCVPFNDASSGSVMSMEHKHRNKPPKSVEKRPAPVVYDLSNEEKDTVSLLESCGIVGSSAFLVKKHGVAYCQKYAAWFKAYEGEKKPGLLFRAMKEGWEVYVPTRSGGKCADSIASNTGITPHAPETNAPPRPPVLSRPLDRETVKTPINNAVIRGCKVFEKLRQVRGLTFGGPPPV